jgi:hypothetical protein
MKEQDDGRWTFNETDGFKTIRREGEAVGCRFGGKGEATWTARLLEWGTWHISLWRTASMGGGGVESGGR